VGRIVRKFEDLKRQMQQVSATEQAANVPAWLGVESHGGGCGRAGRLSAPKETKTLRRVASRSATR
jgi:hypothetical protein